MLLPVPDLALAPVQGQVLHPARARVRLRLLDPVPLSVPDLAPAPVQGPVLLQA
jgi:hypothetical protein